MQTQPGAQLRPGFDEGPCLWAIVDPEEDEVEKREIVIHGTGHPISMKALEGSYIGTFQLMNGQLVFHVFEAAFTNERT